MKTIVMSEAVLLGKTYQETKDGLLYLKCLQNYGYQVGLFPSFDSTLYTSITLSFWRERISEYFLENKQMLQKIEIYLKKEKVYTDRLFLSFSKAFSNMEDIISFYQTQNDSVYFITKMEGENLLLKEFPNQSFYLGDYVGNPRFMRKERNLVRVLEKIMDQEDSKV